ncbi:uncharacterized protein LOC111085814 [Limulus polyphemus]|uniref:Uncharacterized protein LOC111085814 n=1 Tax=Limulus polyphemus TaxID=6850 RepID=A0ABM1SDY0_LIMPO|nr:uncharacterized protein LOC111085814 [Limulus polyphemus]
MEFRLPTSFPIQRKVLEKWKHLLDEKRFKALQPIQETFNDDVGVRHKQIGHIHESWMMELEPINHKSRSDDLSSCHSKQSFQDYVDSFNRKRHLPLGSEDNMLPPARDNSRRQKFISKSLESLKLPPINQRFPEQIYVDTGVGPLNYWQTIAADNFIDSELRKRTRLRMREKVTASQVCMNYEEETEEDPELVDRELGLSKKRSVVKGPKETNTHSRWMSKIPGLSWKME